MHHQAQQPLQPLYPQHYDRRARLHIKFDGDAVAKILQALEIEKKSSVATATTSTAGVTCPTSLSACQSSSRKPRTDARSVLDEFCGKESFELVTTEPLHTVQQVKETLRERLSGLPVYVQRLFVNGQEMLNKRTLVEYGTNTKNTLRAGSDRLCLAGCLTDGCACACVRVCVFPGIKSGQDVPLLLTVRFVNSVVACEDRYSSSSSSPSSDASSDEEDDEEYGGRSRAAGAETPGSSGALLSAPRRRPAAARARVRAHAHPLLICAYGDMPADAGELHPGLRRALKAARYALRHKEYPVLAEEGAWTACACICFGWGLNSSSEASRQDAHRHVHLWFFFRVSLHRKPL